MTIIDADNIGIEDLKKLEILKKKFNDKLINILIGAILKVFPLISIILILSFMLKSGFSGGV